MKILVDADACPVKAEIKKVAQKYNIEVIMVCDMSHELNDDYCKIITVDKFADSADISLINLTDKSDIVISQDYGVATLAIGKGAIALDNFGNIYDNQNIDKLLFERFLCKKNRRVGIKLKGPSKRKKTDNDVFCKKLENIVSKNCIDNNKLV